MIQFLALLSIVLVRCGFVIGQALPTVTLEYSTIQANSYNATGDFYVYANVRFAAPPVGSLRFQEPQPPLQDTTINDGSVTGNCFTQEDCLFLDIYVPASAQAGSNLSVVLYLYGGGYNGGSKDNNNPAGLLKQSGNSIIFVAPNYRLGIFGFAGGATMKANGVANPGFYDQRAAFEWVQNYIWAFGGNPNDITGMGLSSGGSSMLFQIAAFGGNSTLPFQKVISQSPAWSPHSNQVEAEQFVQNVTTAVNCSDFACLQGVEFATLNTAVTAVLQYGYILQPRVDGVFVPELLDVMFTSGKFNPNVQVLVSHEQHESLFRPPTVVTFDDSIQALWPDISTSAFNTIESLYPPYEFDFNDTTRFLQADNDYQFNCKIYALSNAFNGETYNYYFSVPPAIHTTDDPYTFNGGMHEADGFVMNSTVADILQKYLISFIKTGNPNTEYPGLLNWPVYATNGGTEININLTFIDLIPTDLDTPQCQWWVQGLY